MTADLSSPPTVFRSTISRGTETDSPVDRTGGMFGAGLISGVSVITRGEALGHDLWIDTDFLSDVTAGVNGSRATSGGVKARFTHPGMSSDGMGSQLGRITDARTVGDQVFADLHFTEASHHAPDGDLADYVMSLAEETPDDFGLSIVFNRDVDAEEEFRTDHSIAQGDDSVFQSPDSENKKNYRHARLARLRGADVVDEPAANPSGMFSTNDIPAKAESVLSYVLGLSETSPGSIGGIDAERMSGFFARFLDRQNLEIRNKEMSDETDVVDRGQVETEVRSELKAEADRYTKAFGENGSAWFFEGLSFEEAQGRHIESLEKSLLAKDEELSALQSKLESLDTGEPEPLSVDGKPEEKKTFASKIRIVGASAAAAN